MPLIVGQDAVPRLNCLHRIHRQHNLEGTRRVAKTYRGLPEDRKEGAQLLGNREFDIALLSGFGITREDSCANQYLYLISQARKGSLAAKALLNNVAGEPLLELSDLGTIKVLGRGEGSPTQVIGALLSSKLLFDLLTEEGISFTVNNSDFVLPSTHNDAANILLILNTIMHAGGLEDCLYLPVDQVDSASSFMTACAFRPLYNRAGIRSFYQKGKFPIIPPHIPHFFDIENNRSSFATPPQAALAIVVGSGPADD